MTKWKKAAPESEPLVYEWDGLCRFGAQDHVSNGVCGREPRTRDLCRSHYTVAARQVQTGNATWDELEERGACGPLRGRAKNVAAFFTTRDPSDGQ